jgi:fermentation-respiration switch protein FrsA (DUF1100 family)
MAEITQAERFAQAAKAQNSRSGRPWHFWPVRVAAGAAGLYVLLCLGLFIFQKSLIFRPTAEENLSAKESGFAAQQAQDIQTTTSDGVLLHGWHIANIGGLHGELSKAHLVVLFFGGNRGNRSYRDAKFRRLASLGADVVCFDYRGYGDSAGSPSEEGLALDARAAWDYLRKLDVKPEAIVLHGESLGGAVAIRLASELSAEHTPPAGLMVEGTFTRLTDVAKNFYPFVPVNLIVNQNFRSIDAIGSVACPILMIHGKCDSTVPIALGRQLFAAAPEKAREISKQFVELHDCAHADIGIQDAKEYDAALHDFMKTVCPSKSGIHTEHRPLPEGRHPKAHPAMNQPNKANPPPERSTPIPAPNEKPAN